MEKFHNKYSWIAILAIILLAGLKLSGQTIEDSVKSEIERLDIKFPNIVLAQAKLETGNFKKLIFTKKHNLFGFNSSNGYIMYPNWKSSILAYKQWQDKYYKEGDYYLFLRQIGYAKDPDYIKKLIRCLK